MNREVPGVETPEDDDWAAAVSGSWAADWDDPREDIYSLEDGMPEDALEDDRR